MNISVIIPNHNNGHYLPRCLESVLNQSVPPVEVVVCDDFSTDNSRAVVRGYAERYPTVRVVEYAAKSVNWLQALYAQTTHLKGHWIHNVSADDYVLPGFYAAALQLTEPHPTAGCIFADSWHVDRSGRWVGQPGLTSNEGYLSGEPLWELLGLPMKNPGGAAALITAAGMQFLVAKEAWRMGPWNDSIGNAILAAQSGAFFLRKVYGCITLEPGIRHGDRVLADLEACRECVAAVCAFLDDEDVKRTVPARLLRRLRWKVLARLPAAACPQE